MHQLREFAQHASEFERLSTRVAGISVDDQGHNRTVWERVTNRQFSILSDPGAKVIREYGLLHPAGKGDQDIAIRTTLLIDENGVERWRRVSSSTIDIPKCADILARIRSPGR
jgi:peroxiredoxin